MNRKFRIVSIIALLLFLSFGAIQTSHAALNAVSAALDPNGFPLWYRDTNGVTLAPCFTASPAGNLCVLLPDIGFNPANEIVFPTNFPPEFFYWIAEPDFTLTDPTGAVVQIRFALEGSFAGGVPLANDQVVFQRKRFRVNVPNGGSITINHPYGTDSFTDGVAPDKPPVVDGVIDVTFDEPVNLIPGDFQSAVTANLIGPFLVAANPAPQAGFVGDFVTAQTVTGGPLRQNITISGAVNVSTDLWLVSGQQFSPPLKVDSATFSRDAVSGQVDISATSLSTASVTVDGIPGLAGPQPLTGAQGTFTGTFNVADPTLLPATVSLTASDPSVANTTTLSADLVDIVSISLAEFDTTTKTLTVQASSTDQATTLPTLTAQGFGDLVAGNLTVPVASKPDSVTVTSTSGGSATQTVTQTTSGPIEPETITITMVKFMTKPAKWIIKGKTTLKKRTDNTMTIRLGDGTLIGSKAPTKAGTWSFTMKKAPAELVPAEGDTITVESANLATASRAVTIR